MNSAYRRKSPNRIHPGGSLVSFDSDEGHSFKLIDSLEGQSFKLVDNTFAPFEDEYYHDGDFIEDEYYHRPRTVDNYYGIRQEYLRSYTFTRDEEKPEKLKDSVRRLKAVIWAVLCCKYKYTRAKALRERLSSRSARIIHDSTDYISASCRKITVPSCIRMSNLEVL